MNPYEDTKDVKLVFDSEYSNKQSLFGFNNQFQNFKTYTCKIPLNLPEDFKKEYLNWFDDLKQSDIIILVEKYDVNKYEIITSNKNQGFQKFLIAGIINYFHSNFDIIFEKKISEIDYFDTRMYKDNEDFIINKILSPPEGEELVESIITDFIKNIKYKSPKSKYLKFSFKGENKEKEDIKFDLDIINPIESKKNNKEIYYECCKLFDSLYIDDKLTDFEIYIQTPEDPKMPKLCEIYKELQDSINFTHGKDIWSNLLISIGSFGILRVYNGEYLEDFINILENKMNINEYDNKYDYIKNYRIMIKTIYKYMNDIYGISNENFNIFMFTILNSWDTNEEYLIKRCYFNIRANNLLKKINTPNSLNNNQKNGLIKKFIQNNGVYFSKKQLEEMTSFYYVEQILSNFTK